VCEKRKFFKRYYLQSSSAGYNNFITNTHTHTHTHTHSWADLTMIWACFIALFFYICDEGASSRALAGSRDLHGSGIPEVTLEFYGITTCRVVVNMYPTFISNFSEHSILSIWSRHENSSYELLNAYSIADLYSEPISSHPRYMRLSSQIYPSRAINLRAVLRLGSEGDIVPYSNLPSLVDDIYVSDAYNSLGYKLERRVAPQVFDTTNQCTTFASVCDWIRLVDSSIIFAEKRISKLTEQELAYYGMSGPHFRHFFNNIGAHPDIRYLEVGVYAGSTFISMLHGNNVTAIAMDAWDFEIGDSWMNEDDTGNAREFFDSTISDYVGNNTVYVHQVDCWNASRSVSLDLTGKPSNIFFYDAGHSMEDQFAALLYFYPSLDDIFMFVIDDWAVLDARVGTLASIAAMPVMVMAEYELLTTDINIAGHPWHNGAGIFILCKKPVCG
jgi:hypothetical protein